MINNMYYILAFYQIVAIEDPEAEVKKWHHYFADKDSKGRIYISHKGINAQLSISESQAPELFSWLKEDPRYKDIDIKIHRDTEHVFAKMTIKYRKELAVIEKQIDFSKRAEHIPPEQWKKMLDARDEQTVVIDVRNDYEWDVGHFVGAERPTCKTFRDFPKIAKDLAKKYDPKKTKMMLFCTGGIRCEFFSPLLKEEGFESIYQLDGGVIKYGQKEGTKHWKGNLFVFDDRLVVPIDEKEKNEPITQCHFCQTSIDTYYNCANMDCNALFIACKSCSKEHQGCCNAKCEKAPRRRPFEEQERVKPYRKLPFEEKCALKETQQL